MFRQRKECSHPKHQLRLNFLINLNSFLLMSVRFELIIFGNFFNFFMPAENTEMQTCSRACHAVNVEENLIEQKT